jgi:hypothetical protein
MRFSVLLPTRNGGDFLDNCIRSILEQDHDDFELVISDNANSDATPDIIRTYSGDARLKVVRQPHVISVAENWTAALQASQGEYVLMMGDDDYLLPGALARLDDVLVQYGGPECVLYNGYSYVAPRAIGDDPASYWAPEHYRFGADFGDEGVLERQHRFDIVADMFHFRQRIPLNMQTTLFARRAIERESQGVFRAPFPDHYLLNALLITADNWVYLPDRLVVVGVSPKSFGHYFYSQKAGSGLAYLGISTDFPGALPGNELLNGTCAWLLDLKDHYPEALAGVRIDRRSYVRRQVYSWLLQRRYGGIDMRELAARLRRLSLADWLRLLATVLDGESWRRLGRLVLLQRKSQAETLWHGLRPLPDVGNIREFALWVLRRSDDLR